MRSTAFGIILSLLPVAATGNAITFEIWPTSDPDDATFCVLRLSRGMITAVHVRGQGMPPVPPQRWPARDGEIAGLMAGLQALVSQDLPSVEVYASRRPAPPFITATWAAKVNGGMAHGLYVQSGLALPQVLAQVITTLVPGGPCAAAIG